MSKRPSFQFYPPDWRNEAGLRLCSMAARGLWIDMMCLMHDSEPYGHLTDMGRPMTPEALSRLVGESAASVKRWLAELGAREVFSVSDDGVIFSRRMVRDEAVRDARAAGGAAGAEHGRKGAEHGAKGGRPKKEETAHSADQRGDNKPPLEPPPSSSSSSPPSEDGSEDKSSARPKADDPDGMAWFLAVDLLIAKGGMTDKAARAFFGRLLSQNGLKARDLLPAAAAASASATQDPQGYLTKAAKGVAGRRGSPQKTLSFV